MTYRVIQWATGGVGKASIEAILDHPQLQLVGCWVHSDEKNGKDVGEILGIETLVCLRPQARKTFMPWKQIVLSTLRFSQMTMRLLKS